ncbi:MAG TPA: DUF6777 domain-containing protein [Pseudonocardiaceae bacterium]|nr:DUF6777 domain-containing protein [Pseudonocardiaceae bacterium]
MMIRRLYSHRILVALLLSAVLAVGLLAILVIRQQRDQANAQIYLEAGGNVGSNPFVPLVVPPSGPGGNPGGEDASFRQAAGAGAGTTCDPEKLISYLTGDQQVGEAWIRALNYDRTLSWSGGGRIEIQQISAYIRELTPRLLTDDLRVTNYQFTNGVALPVQSVLEKGTAVLVDAKGTARVRCVSGNPLTPMIQLKVPPVYRGTPWPSFQAQRVAATQRAPQCGDNEFYDGANCRHNAACPPGEDHGGDGRCHVPAEPVPPSKDGAPDAQEWGDKPGRAVPVRHPDELPSRNQQNHPDDPARPETPVTPERPERPGRPVTPVKPEHPDKPVIQETPESPDKPPIPDKPEKPGKSDTPAEPDKPGKPQRPERPTQPAESRKPDKATRPHTSGHEVSPGSPDDDPLGQNPEPEAPKRRAVQSAQPDKNAQPGKPAQPDKTARADKANQTDESSVPDQSPVPAKDKSDQLGHNA